MTLNVTVTKCPPDVSGGAEWSCRYPTTCAEKGECCRDDDAPAARQIETDPYAAWHKYARKAGLLDERGEAPDRMKAHTAFYAFAYAWNLLVNEHILKRGTLS